MRSCWRYRTKVRGKERVFYVGKGAAGPNDELAKADAIREALACRERAESDAQVIREAKNLTGGMKALAE